MKVLSIVSYNFLPAKMGGQKGIALFNDWLSKKLNLSVVTIASNDTTLVDYKIFNVLSNSKFRYINPFIFFSVKKIIRNNQISHVIIEHPYYAWLGYLLKIFCKVKLIVHSHNIESERFRSLNKSWWKVLWYYERWIHQRVDFNFFITENDLQYAVNFFNLDSKKCKVITYGFDLQTMPAKDVRKQAAEKIRKLYTLNDSCKILLFNGTLAYKANLKALDIILKNINPSLLQQNSFEYKIIICGKDLPEVYNHLEAYKASNIIYAGFVDDIKEYYLAADIFINPVNDGGGIKTKIVEALGYNVSLVTTKSGAIGIPPDIVGNKMKVIDDNDWDAFAKAIVSIDIKENIPTQYFEHFYWGHIADKASKYIATC